MKGIKNRVVSKHRYIRESIHPAHKVCAALREYYHEYSNPYLQ